VLQLHLAIDYLEIKDYKLTLLGLDTLVIELWAVSRVDENLVLWLVVLFVGKAKNKLRRTWEMEVERVLECM